MQVHTADGARLYGVRRCGEGALQPDCENRNEYGEVLEAAGGIQEGKEAQKYLSGGPMMGMALADLEVPICKNNNALTVLGEDPVALAERQATYVCACGR